jgi:peptide/nickel transport system permease protein
VGTYVIRRIVVSIPLLIAVSLVVFLLGRLVPGDPVRLFLAANNVNDPELVARIRAEYGLDRPLPEQYVRWLAKAVRGDFGDSIRSGTPVNGLLWRALGHTAIVALAAVLLVILFGWTFGVISAVVSTRSPGFGFLFGLAPIVMLSIPSFSLAAVLIYVFAVRLQWLPTGGMYDVRKFNRELPDLAKHLVLPAIALAWTSLGSNWRLARNTVVDVLGEDYVRTAYAKGLRERRIFYVHALRNAMIPLVTSAGLLLGSLLTGAFILEYLFSWPGIGALMVEAVLNRDYPVVQAATIVLAAIYLAINLVVDLAYAAIDPRIRYG